MYKYRFLYIKLQYLIKDIKCFFFVKNLSFLSVFDTLAVFAMIFLIKLTYNKTFKQLFFYISNN